ncbi:NAD-dependent epimerase/dehydratase family protein [Flavobacteriaceae bacterium AU392]|nr:NAD-dependent epimerase/dehydratase family protein [Flavobacteriaceae bacterium]RKM82952.1 NAD-dependent epimerase/dehydratase family protein [Flavobacteriaceae bacterium AU392]
MKILLTGGSGMVGKNILEFNANSKQYNIVAPSRNQLDLENYKEVNKYIKLHHPDYIIHAAGLVGGIQDNIANPVNFLVKNLDMGRNLILAAKENKIKYFINLSSSCMYPREATNPLNENLILKGELEPTNEGYALAKIISTRLCEYINKENNYYQYKTVIPCNLYGKYDKFSFEHSHMVPAVIRKIDEAKTKSEKSVTIWGTGEARREFMYAEDFADFIFYAIEHFHKMPQNINVGLGHDYTINDYYKEIANVIGYTGTFKHDISKPVGMTQKLIDDTRLTIFGWKAKTTLQEGLKKTYEYYKEVIE